MTAKGMAARVHLRSLNQKELTEFLSPFGQPKFRAIQILDWLHKKHAVAFAEMTNLSMDFRNRLQKEAMISALELVDAIGADHRVRSKFGGRAPERQHEGQPLEIFDRESVKYLMKTQDNHLLECVLIVQRDRKTVCVSTQLGCRIRCSFCASGKGKFGRNLTAGEIVEQVSQMSRHLLTVPCSFNKMSSPNVLVGDLDSRLKRSGMTRAVEPVPLPVTNVVFMGMGEPLDNYEATMRAIEILTADWGFGLGGRRITVSTSGLTPMIERFVNDSRGRVRLSVSLHSSDQATRSRLVPINKKYQLAELIDTLERIQKNLKREITFEYTLIEGVNDSAREARGVGRLAGRLGAKVNLIPYNPIQEMDYKTPSRQRVESFRQLLEEKQVRVTVRQTAGRDIDAACGQLRLDRACR